MSNDAMAAKLKDIAGQLQKMREETDMQDEPILRYHLYNAWHHASLAAKYLEPTALEVNRG